MMFVRDHGQYLVIASNNGATADPEWYKNLLAHPDVTVEVPGQEFSARAAPLEGRDYDREWARIQQNYPFFTEHQQRGRAAHSGRGADRGRRLESLAAGDRLVRVRRHRSGRLLGTRVCVARFWVARIPGSRLLAGLRAAGRFRGRLSRRCGRPAGRRRIGRRGVSDKIVVWLGRQRAGAARA